MSERRQPPSNPPINFPQLPPKVDPQSDLGILWRSVLDLIPRLSTTWEYQRQAYDSIPAPHGSTHDADGDDPLTTPGTPTTISPDDTAAAGDGPAYAYEDHVHAITAAAPGTIAPDDTASEGSATSFARSDHRHAITCATPTNATGTAFAEGSASTFMRSDATIKQGIVTTKGDILGYSTVPERVPVGADFRLLEAAAAATPGVQWSSLVTVLGRLLGNQQIITKASGTVVAVDRWSSTYQKTLTDGVLTNIFEVGIGTDETSSGQMRWGIMVHDGTDQQHQTGIIAWAAVNKGGVFTVNDPYYSELLLGDARSAGTITRTWTITPGASKITVGLTANTSLTPTFMAIQYNLEEFGDEPITLL